MTLPEDPVYQFAAAGGIGDEMAACFAARSSGLYSSVDGGQTWEPAFSSLTLHDPLSALSVVVSPDFGEEPGVYVGLNGGILLSPDGGKRWENASVPTPPPAATTLAISPDFIRDGILFAGTLEDGVLCSSDRGRHWAAWNFGLLDLNILCLAISPGFADDETLFAGTQSGIFRSANGGRSWREVDLPFGFEAVLSLAISPDFVQDATLFAGTENQGLFRSTDGGQTWQRLGKSRFRLPINGIFLAPNFQTRPEILVWHGRSMLISADDGKTWTPWREKALSGKNFTAILAPRGFDDGFPALVGFENGPILVA